MRIMAVRGRQILEDEQVDEKDLKIAELQRVVEQLQRRLERQDECNQRREGYRQSSEEEPDVNPFHEEDEYDPNNVPRYHRRNQQRHYGRAHDGDIKVDIPEFEGKQDGDVFLDWLYTVERVFDFKEYSDERKVKLVAIKMKGYAFLWWENLKKERTRVEKEKIRTWDKMKRELKK